VGFGPLVMPLIRARNERSMQRLKAFVESAGRPMVHTTTTGDVDTRRHHQR
jgi:hypothetical protein